MAVPFAQTTRSLNADRGFAALILVALLSLMLTIWLVWAFTAQFSVYASSGTTDIRLDNTITTLFPAEAGKRLATGQKALVYLDAPPLSEPVILPAQVSGLAYVSDGVRVQVVPDFRQLEAGTMSSEVLAAFSTPVSGHIEVQSEVLSPAQLILRSAGLNADTAPLVNTK